jgi:2-polyprenyl-6-methoxyphenol hydroxylase-like FAD-dependent oxidoreductase
MMRVAKGGDVGSETIRVLVIGGGVAGCAAGILLSRGGVVVDLVEQQASVTALGSGITLQGNALRVLRELRVLDEVLERGFPFDMVGLRTPAGDLLAAFPDFKMGGPDLPAALGMRRPELARILVEAALASGVTVRVGTTVLALDDDGATVMATFSDATTGRYDLVIGADGVNSLTRRLLGIDAEPVPLGMGIFRIFCERPASIDRTDLIYGGRCYIAGYCPTSEESMYAYLIEDSHDRTAMSPDESLSLVRELAGHYHGPWDDISERLVDESQINYTWFETHLIEGPWNRGRVVLIGDAAHSCPPTLAQGAAMALEDASVLAELVLSRAEIDDELFALFMDRRYERAKTVVDNSVQLCTWLLEHNQEADLPGMFARTAAMLTAPA